MLPPSPPLGQSQKHLATGSRQYTHWAPEASRRSWLLMRPRASFRAAPGETTRAGREPPRAALGFDLGQPALLCICFSAQPHDSPPVITVATSSL
jgi:hypothetical protein